MKKLLAIVLVIGSLSVQAQRVNKSKVKTDTTVILPKNNLQDSIQQPKALIIQGDLTAFQALIEALDKSEDSHRKVEAIKSWIFQQLEKQLPKTQK